MATSSRRASIRLVRRPPARATDWLERAALGGSIACLVHCLGLPLLLAALTVIATVVAVPEGIHIWLLGLAIPMSGTTLLLGFRKHRARLSLFFGCFGLGLMAVGALGLIGGRFETPVTVAGSLALAIAHLANWAR